MKLYHVCVLYIDGISYYNGIFESDINLKDPKAYNIFKDEIGALMHPTRKGKDLIILSLTVID